MALPIALQLYTVREELEKDFDATLQAVARMGYTHVEFAGFYNRTAEQIRDACAKLNLTVTSAHMGVDACIKEPGAVAQFARTVGFEYVVMPYLPQELRTEDGYRKAAEQFNQAGANLQKEGLTFGYHNHAFEFEPLPSGTCGQEIIFDSTDPKLVISELDTCWVHVGGQDPTAWMERLSGRCPLLHIKDVQADGQFIEVGAGEVNLAAVAAKAASVGSRFFIIEQDNHWTGGPLASAQASLEGFRRILQG